MQLPKYLLLITIVYSFKGVVALSYLLFFKKKYYKNSDDSMWNYDEYQPHKYTIMLVLSPELPCSIFLFFFGLNVGFIWSPFCDFC
jgi:hypothetical protein